MILAMAVLFGNLLLRVLPYRELKEFKNHAYSTLVYDRNGNLLCKVPLENGLVREFVPLKEIPASVRKAFIKAEDRRFYFHFGIDIPAVFRAAVQNSMNGRNVSGASTITMQLARMISPSKKRSFSSKVKDLFNAFRLEAKLSKKQILELYLNNIPFGNNIESVAGAAFYFYGKDVRSLSLEEGICLSVIPRNPALYNPNKNPEKVAAAGKRIFKNHISYEVLFEIAKSSGSYRYENRMPHYLRFLQNRYSEVFKTSREIFLSCDFEVQQFAQKKLIEALENSRDSRIQNGAVFVIEVETGAIVAWVGSQSFYDDFGNGQIDGILNRMQPGSSMKPFLYGAALEYGLIQPSSVLADIPMEYGDLNLYIPSNFNNRFNGPVKTRVALASSLNIPAVELLDEFGVPEYLKMLGRLGFKSLEKTGEEYGLSLALGGGEVSLYELVTAFSVFCRDGIYIEANPFLMENTASVRGGNSGFEKGEKVYSQDTARIICQFLSDKKARALGFGLSQVFQTEYPSVFKTGTSNQFQNITALGATKNYAVGVWMGNFNGHTVIGKTGSSLPASIAKSVLDFLEQGNERSEFLEPDSFHLEKICTVSGMAPGDFCSDAVYEYVKNGTELPGCSWHRHNNNSTETIVVYPAEYQQWYNLYGKNQTFSEVDYSSLPLEIHRPNQNSIYYYDDSNLVLRQVIPVEVFGGNGETLEVFLDGKSIGTYSRPFSFSIPAVSGKHRLEVFCGKENDAVEFEVR